MQFNNVILLVATSIIKIGVYGQPANSSPNTITNQLDKRTFLLLLQMKQQLLGMMMGGGGFGGNSNSGDSMSYKDHQSQASHSNNQGSNQGSNQSNNQESSHSNNQISSQGLGSNKGSGQKEINITNVFNGGHQGNGSGQSNSSSQFNASHWGTGGSGNTSGSSQFTTTTSHQNFNGGNLNIFQGYCSNKPGITCRVVCQVSKSIQSNSDVNQSNACNNSANTCDVNSTSCLQSYDPKDCCCECQSISKGSNPNSKGTGNSSIRGSRTSGRGSSSVPSTSSSGKGSAHGLDSYHY